jgi:hypothetical protein
MSCFSDSVVRQKRFHGFPLTFVQLAHTKRSVEDKKSPDYTSVAHLPGLVAFI